MPKSPHNATALIADRILADIISNALPFGSRLRLESLSERYGVGHMPVREALRRLQGEGLVVIQPNRGARVREADATYIRNVFDLRMAIESLMARRAAQRITAAEIKAVTAAQLRFEELFSAQDYAAMLLQNRVFHRIIESAAGNPEAAEVLERHWRPVVALWKRVGFGKERLPAVVSDHRQIVRALADRDADAAASFMTAHVARAKQELLARIAS